MKFARSILTGAGAVVLAGLILALLAPKAAHAIVATAVQVTNTAVAPAVTQDVSNLAAQQVQLICPPNNNGCFIFPDTGLGLAYTVPAGHTFVITSVDFVWLAPVEFAPAPAVSRFFCGPTSTAFDQFGEWFLAGGAAPTHFVYPSGASMPSGCTPFEVNQFNSSYDVLFRGYLTTN